MSDVPKVPRAKTPNPPDAIDARWASLEAMSPADWSKVAARVSVCMDCLGPVLLSDAELALLACEPRCRGCRAKVAA